MLGQTLKIIYLIEVYKCHLGRDCTTRCKLRVLQTKQYARSIIIQGRKSRRKNSRIIVGGKSPRSHSNKDISSSDGQEITLEFCYFQDHSSS